MEIEAGTYVTRLPNRRILSKFKIQNSKFKIFNFKLQLSTLHF